MVLSDSQIANLLFKVKYGAADTEQSRQYYEEPASYNVVYGTSIYSQDIPLVNPLSFADPDLTISGVVQVVHDVSLLSVAGTSNAFYSVNLIDCIRHNHDATGGTYNVILKKSDNTVIPFGLGDWLIDPAAGILRFYGSLPSGVSAGLPPKISFFKYVGSKGVTAGALNNLNNLGITGIGIFKNVVGTTGNFYRINSLHSGLTLTLDNPGGKIDFDLNLGGIDHNSLSNLTVGDPHTQYFKSAGRALGQIIYGGTNPGDCLTINATSHATKGNIYFNDPVYFGQSTVFCGKHAAKKIMASAGLSDICTIIMGNTVTQCVTLKVTFNAWSVVDLEFKHYIAYIALTNTIPGQNVTHELINEIAKNPDFVLVDGVGNSTFKIRYTANIGDIVCMMVEFLVGGPNHFASITLNF